MSATIVGIQNAVLTALQTLAGASPPVAFTPRIAEDDIVTLPDTGPADVVIGFEASSRLGRTGSTLLEQFLVPVTIKRRYAVTSQSDLSANHQLAEILRDSLATFHNSTMRVDSLLSPHPFDNLQATGPGVYVSRFVLDLDVLRTVNSITQDTTTPNAALTVVRKAVWNALNHWPEWTTLSSFPFTRLYQSDDDLDELALHDPGEFDLPAIAVTWGPTAPRFFVHTAQEWPATINVTAWFPAHQATLAEYRAWQIVRAVYQCADPSTPTISYVRAATGRIPEKDAPITMEPVELGRSQQLKAIKLTCQFVLTNIVSPLTD